MKLRRVRPKKPGERPVRMTARAAECRTPKGAAVRGTHPGTSHRLRRAREIPDCRFLSHLKSSLERAEEARRFHADEICRAVVAQCVQQAVSSPHVCGLGPLNVDACPGGSADCPLEVPHSDDDDDDDYDDDDDDWS